jgi:predicted helicase
VKWAKHDVTENFEDDKLIFFQHRPLDFRNTFYSGRSRGFIGTPGYKIMRHLLFSNNVCLIAARQCKNDFGVFISQFVPSHKACVAYDINTIYPLYLYPDENILDKTELRRPNLNMEIVNKMAEKINLVFTFEKQEDQNTFAPIDILDYIYAVLYSNKYRQKYMEFLKIDFPRVPYPENAEQFYSLSAIGSTIRNLHLMESVTPLKDLATFPVEGSNTIGTIKYKDGKVYINKTQYFENISPEIWEYYIGGYQPAQKWLKDRKERTLDFSEKEHYQKIIAVLSNTINLQAQIDEIIEV